jgi:outer membrane protein assembly factor BamB
MSTSRPDRRQARQAQIRRRRIIAGVVAVAVVVLLVVGIGALAGWFKKSPQADKTATAPSAAKTAANNRAAALVNSGAWPTFGNTPGNTRADTAVSSALPFRTLWTANTGGLIELPPVIGDGRVVVANYGYGLAYNLQTGALLWKRALGSRLAASPALTGLPSTPSAGEPQRAIFANQAGDVYALDPATGAQIWKVALGSSVETSPLVIGDGVFVGTRAGEVVRISLTSHQIVWQEAVAGSVKGAIADAGSHIIVGNYGGQIEALDPSNGAVVWQTTAPSGYYSGSGRFYGAAAVAGGQVLAGNTNGDVLGINAGTGQINWTAVTGGYVYSSPAVAYGLVFIGSYDHNLYAFNAQSGHVVWQRDMGYPISGSPSVIGNMVWIATLGATAASGHLYALDARTGALELTRQNGRYAAPVAVQGIIVAPGLDEITALAPS